MKILWVKADFLHPTTKGGRIRSLEILKRLHRRHEIHYVALDDPWAREGASLARASEYCSQAYPIPHWAPAFHTTGFRMQALGAMFSNLPLAVFRFRSEAMKRQIEMLMRRERFDSVVCDFLFPASNIPDLGACVLFQHNVEAVLWGRLEKHARSRLRRLYFGSQARRLQPYEAAVCRAAKRVVAVSEPDATTMRSMYGASRVAAVPTGVDLDYFKPSQDVRPSGDLVFTGSMDWEPNVDGIHWFVDKVLPAIRRRRPNCSVTIAGRMPSRDIHRVARRDARIHVTGTVPDIRPYLWGSSVSIVPLRIGGGTRLKIYEAMAAKVPVVSTAVGAEGLDVRDGENIQIADAPAEFAERCIALLDDAVARKRMASVAWDRISSCYSWEVVSRKFEELL